MKAKRAVVESRKQTLENAKILMSWLYNQEKGFQTIENLEKSFLEELKLTTGECIGVVDLFAEFADGSKASGRKHLRDVIEQGIDLPDDIANFYIDLKVLRTDKSEHHIMGSYLQQIFQSDIFYIKENNKSQITDSCGIIINNIELYSSMSGDHIRFYKHEDVIEV